MAEWTNIELKIFQSCSQTLKYEEILHTVNFNTHDIMSALDVNSPRIDGHLLTRGLYDISDVLTSNKSLLNADLSIDEIRGICGKLYDLQLARLNGYSVFQTYFISIYANAQMEIKNELLKHVVHAFACLWDTIEKISMSIIPNSINYWTMNKDYTKVIHKYDENSTRKFLEKYKAENQGVDDIIDTAIFEIDFADFLNNFPKNEFPKIPNFVRVTSEIGIYPSIHFRKLPPHSPPGKVIFYEHLDSISRFMEFLYLIKKMIDFPKLETIEDIIDHTFRWGYANRDAISFARIFLAGIIVQNGKGTVFNDLPIGEFFKKDLLRYRVPENIFRHEKYSLVAKQTLSFLDSIVRTFLAPLPYAHGTLSKYMFQSWCDTEQSIVFLEHCCISGWRYPALESKEYGDIIRNAVVLWSAPISTKLTQYYIVLGFETNTYGKDDHAIAAAIMSSCLDPSIYQIERKAVSDAIYQVADHKKSPKRKIVSLKLAEFTHKIIIPTSYYDFKARSAYFNGCFHLARWCYKVGAINHHKGAYYNAGSTFLERSMHPNTLFLIKIMEKEQFESQFRYEEVDGKDISSQARERFDEAKKYLTKAISLDTKTDERNALFKSIILATAVLIQWKEGWEVRVTYTPPNCIDFSIIK